MVKKGTAVSGVLSGAAAALGGKASWLVRLSEAGNPVPDFVTVPHGVQLPEGAEARARFVRELRAAGLSGPLIVRSSAEGEDAPGASFAGLFSSVLAASADAVPVAVAEVRSRLRSGELDAYVRAVGAQAPVRMHAIVQKFVEAEWYGVWASDGASERARRSRRHDGVTDGGDSRELAADAFPFAEDVLRACRRAAEVLPPGGRDVEWAYARGKVWILQARPLSFGKGPSARVSPEGR